jgi:hypothetical protein
MRQLLAGVCTGVAIAGATGAVASGGTDAASVTVRPGPNGYVRFAGIDLNCSFGPHLAGDPDPGPYLYCARTSTRRSRALNITGFHYEVTNAQGNSRVYRVTRAP